MHSLNMDDNEENTFKVGDVCLDCQQRGIEKYLRYFKINLNGGTLLKCESNVCMYPYDMSSTDDEDSEDADEKAELQSISETNSIKFIDDLLQQINNESGEQNCNYTESSIANHIIEGVNNAEYCKDNSNEMNAEFEICFFDNFEKYVNESSTNTVTSIGLNGNELPSQKPIDKFVDNSLVREAINSNQFLENKSPKLPTASLHVTEEIQHIDKPKINIQSIEFLKLNQHDNTKWPISTEISRGLKLTELTTAPTSTTSDELSVINATTANRKMEKADNIVSNKLSCDVLVKHSKNSVPTNTLDIPKANIMKGSDFLKKLSIIDEKTPKYNTKCKHARKKSLSTKEKIKKGSSSKIKDNERQSESKAVQGNINFSLEAITELINAKKMKNYTKSS